MRCTGRVVDPGLEKLVPSVVDACRVTGAKTLDYSMGEDENVKAAIEVVEGVKGEACLYACTFAGCKEEDLPEWLQKTECDLA